jgi:hypothetical protein
MPSIGPSEPVSSKTVTNDRTALIGGEPLSLSGDELVTGFLRRVVLPEPGTAQPHEWPASSGGARVRSVQVE